MPLLDKSDARVHLGGHTEDGPPDTPHRGQSMGVPGAHGHPFGS